MPKRANEKVNEIISLTKQGKFIGYAEMIKYLYENSQDCKDLIDKLFDKLPDPVDISTFKNVINKRIAIEKSIYEIQNNAEQQEALKAIINELEYFKTDNGSKATERNLMRVLLATLEIYDCFEEFFEEELKPLKDDSYEIASLLFGEIVVKNDIDYLDEYYNVAQPNKSLLEKRKLNSINNIVKALDTKIVGHKQAKEEVAKTIFNYSNGFANKTLIGSFLLAGEPGIGKTEIAKAVADLFFDGRICILRGGDYVTDVSISSLTGSGAGYVGYGEPNAIQQALNKWQGKPGVIVFDEFDQMHHLAQNWIYSILDEGKFNATIKRQNQGYFGDDERYSHIQVDLKDTLIFLTSNLGTTRETIGVKTPINEHEQNKKSVEKIISEGNSKQIARALFDRVKVIPIEKLSESEKINITKRLQRDTAKNLIKIMKEQTKKINKNADELSYKIKFLNNMPKRLLQISNGQIRGVKNTLQNSIKQPIIVEYLQNKKQLKQNDVCGLEFSVSPTKEFTLDNPFVVSTKVIKK